MVEPLLADLGLVFVVAAAVTVAFYRLRLPAVLGYIAVGILLSPATEPRWLTVDAASITTIAQIGVVFLLFAIGLDWSIGSLRRLGPGLLVATPIESALMVGGGYGLGRLFGWTHTEAFLLGAALAVSSTLIIMKVQAEEGQRDTPHGRNAMGMSIMEDLSSVVLLSLVTGILVQGAVDVLEVGRVIGSLLLFVVATLVIGYVLVPQVIGHVARFHVSDVLVVTLVGLAFGLAILAERLGFAAGFGAFLAGFLITGSEQIRETRARIEPLRDTFGAVFFVAVGLQVDPAILLGSWDLVLLAAAGVLVLKPLAVTFSWALVGRGGRNAARSALHMLPVGEMGFVIAGIAAQAGLAPGLLTLLMGVALITTVAAPLVTRSAERIVTLAGHLTPAPVASFQARYAGWVSRLAQRSIPDPDYQQTLRRYGWRFGLNVLFALAPVALAALLQQLLPRTLALGSTVLPMGYALWGLAAVVALPGLYLAVQTLRDLQHLVGEGMMPGRLLASPEGERTVVLRVIRDTAGAGLLVVGAVLVLLAVLPVGPEPPVIVTVGLMLTGALLLVFDAVVAIHRKVQGQFEAAVIADLAPASRREIRRELVDHYPWGVVFEDVEIPEGSPMAGRPLGELALRTRTGATVVSIDRADGPRVVNPGAAAMLREGDRVVLAGEAVQVVQARDLLAGLPSIEDELAGRGIETRQVVVPRESPVAGRRLRELEVRETLGVSVLALIREGQVASHPGPDEVIRAGDRLLLIGTGDQLDLAAGLLSGDRGPQP